MHPNGLVGLALAPCHGEGWEVANGALRAEVVVAPHDEDRRDQGDLGRAQVVTLVRAEVDERGDEYQVRRLLGDEVPCQTRDRHPGFEAPQNPSDEAAPERPAEGR